ncbi:alginate lyase family protein [Aminipila terrae]|uniref:Heparinase n=1 Tax=Aminipila terrae TaxID=2697030 RepID=A0A6P1M989_9FIRM|nr:alginate lyase family protein [Aminipila terrae]QHI71299.1 heparinase [Aminipila terrae]
MKKLIWILNRLKAMNHKEIAWRIQQKLLQKKEGKFYKNNNIAVTNIPLSAELNKLKIDTSRLYINASNQDFSLNKQLSIFDVYSYEEYKNDWNAGFQTDNKWPLTFSYNLDCKQRIDIGDVRTNWELNRHFQFAMLAKNYYASGEQKFLDELCDLFWHWNQNSPFLHGVSWTSPMEVAIRINSWIYTYAFLKMADETKKYTNCIPNSIYDELRLGILNMTDYVANHYSRFSSANNHLIVEAYAIGLSGIVFDYDKWKDVSIDILLHEITEQNYGDGINKELSLHYQTFVMEAYGLMYRMMQLNKITIPDIWQTMLIRMSQYVSNCIGTYGEVIEFGDNDESKILDLSGKGINHYQYVLDLMSCILDTRFTDLTGVSENIKWLFTREQLNECRKKRLYKNQDSICYLEGGNTILRSEDGRVVIGIDHAALGYGSLAAHGHADALSFQMFICGIPVFVDSGTYNYHIMPDDRDSFRRTINHNTVAIDSKDQSEMLGAFLWGRKANVTLNSFELSDSKDLICASHDGYSPMIHNRCFKFNRKDELIIEDEIVNVKKPITATITYLLGPKFDIRLKNNYKVIANNGKLEITISFAGEHKFSIEEYSGWYSPNYLKKQEICGIKINIDISVDSFFITNISVDEKS